MQKYGASIGLSTTTEPRLVAGEGSESLSTVVCNSRKTNVD